jgi:signal peptidase I
MVKGVIEFILVFTIGFLSCYALLNFSSTETPFSEYFSKSVDAPNETINRAQIELYLDKVVINIENAGIGRYAATGSMLPTLNENTKGIRIVPKNEEEIRIGDIVTFEKDGELIIHRVMEKGEDEQGIYFVTRGDNAAFSDGEIRFKDIRYKTIALIY